MSKFDTHGGYFSPKDYLRVNEGGSHEENPNGGVQIGVDPEGNPNLLEEGEPVYKDYVYSDNIEADEKFLVDNNLPKKYAGKLYSKIADDFVTEAEERPLDPISRNGLEVMLGRLAEAQEGQKQAKAQDDLMNELSQLPPDVLERLESMYDQQEQVPIEEVPQEQMTVPEQLPMMGCGGHINKYPEGGTLNPVYVTAKGPKNPGIWDLWLQYQNNPGLRLSPHPIDLSVFNRYGSDDVESDEILNPSMVIDDGPGGYNFNNLVVNPNPERLRIVPHSSYPWPTYTDEEEEVAAGEGTGSEVSDKSLSLLPTWQRYSGAIGSGLLGLYNAFQEPDKYTATRINPYTPEGRIHLQNQVYNPIDQNMIANAQIAQGNATNRALRNSGLGPSTAAAILAADNNTTGNLGTGFLQSWDANNQRRNAVIAANNQAEAQRAQFDANIDYYRKEAQNKAAMYNAQNDLTVQRLNNAAEADKYGAISNQIANGLQALSGIGQENFAMNQINTNPAFLGYRVGPNGEMYYFNPVTQKWDEMKVEEKPAAVTTTTSSPITTPYRPAMAGSLFDINVGLPYSTDPFMGYNTWTLKTNKKKN